MSLRIREARREDSAALADLLGQLGYPSGTAAVEQRLERFGDADRLFVAEDDDRVVGFAGLHVSPSLEYDGDAAKVSAIVVDQNARRRGIGRALMEAVETEARARDCVLLFLTTAERRRDAHAFYGRLGFEETGRRFAKPLR